jgi:hypothetical protein
LGRHVVDYRARAWSGQRTWLAKSSSA